MAINWYEMIVRMINAGRYPSYEEMQLKISNAVLQGLITPEQGEELQDMLDTKESK